MASLEERLRLMKMRNKKVAKELSKTAHSDGALKRELTTEVGPSCEGGRERGAVLETPIVVARQNKTAPELGISESRNPLDVSPAINLTVDNNSLAANSSGGGSLLMMKSNTSDVAVPSAPWSTTSSSNFPPPPTLLPAAPSVKKPETGRYTPGPQPPPTLYRSTNNKKPYIPSPILPVNENPTPAQSQQLRQRQGSAGGLRLRPTPPPPLAVMTTPDLPTPQRSPPILPAVSALKKKEERRRSRSLDGKQRRRDVGRGDVASVQLSSSVQAGGGGLGSTLRASFSASKLDGMRIEIKNRSYLTLNNLGKGGSSQVYSVYDEASRRVCALKVVDLSEADEHSRRAYVNEIKLLSELQGSPHVITMFDYEQRSDELLVLMEQGDTDLSTFLKTRREQIDVAFIRYHWAEMLRAVKVIHDRNIVHSDLKPANFLLVKGCLKLIDFGIASSIPSNKTSVTKEVQMGTLSYMSPESITGEDEGSGGTLSTYKVPLKSDVWSLGCILYSMVYGRSPFQDFKTTAAKMRAITSEAVKIPYPDYEEPLVVDVLKRCLVRSVKTRADIKELLDHPFITGHTATAGVDENEAPDFDFDSLSKKIKEATPRTSAKLLRRLAGAAASSTKSRQALFEK